MTQLTIGEMDFESNLFEKMEEDFLGGYSKEAIKNKLDKVLFTCHMEASEENYKKVRLMLHNLTKASKVNIPAMELADCLISAYTSTEN